MKKIMIGDRTDFVGRHGEEYSIIVQDIYIAETNIAKIVCWIGSPTFYFGHTHTYLTDSYRHRINPDINTNIVYNQKQES